jgi:hypothetical protein
MVRVREMLGAGPSAPLLTAVATAAATDLIVAARSERALSVLRSMRGDRVMPSPELIRACFSACVAGLNVCAAVAIMQFARSIGFFLPLSASSPASAGEYGEGGSWREASANVACGHVLPPPSVNAGGRGGLADGGGNVSGGGSISNAGELGIQQLSEVSFFNGVIQASTFSGKKSAATAAFREMAALGIDGDEETISLLAVLYANLNQRDSAQNATEALRARGERPTAAAYAAMKRIAGSSNDVTSAGKLFHEFERKLVPDRLAFYNLLLTVLSLETSTTTRITANALAAAGADAVLAMFQAYRDTGSAERVFAFCAYLRKAYAFKPTRIVYELMYEVCCRAVPQRLDLAHQLCDEVQRVDCGDGADACMVNTSREQSSTKGKRKRKSKVASVDGSGAA